MNQPRRDLSNPTIGEKFGDLTVLGFHGRNIHGQAVWTFRCKCDARIQIRAHYVTAGKQKSCRRCSLRNAVRAPRPQCHADRNDALVVRFIEGKSLGVIARECGVSRNIVAGAIHRARRRGELKGRTRITEATA